MSWRGNTRWPVLNTNGTTRRLSSSTATQTFAPSRSGQRPTSHLCAHWRSNSQIQRSGLKSIVSWTASSTVAHSNGCSAPSRRLMTRTRPARTTTMLHGPSCPSLTATLGTQRRVRRYKPEGVWVQVPRALRGWYSPIQRTQVPTLHRLLLDDGDIDHVGDVPLSTTEPHRDICRAPDFAHHPNLCATSVVCTILRLARGAKITVRTN